MKNQYAPELKEALLAKVFSQPNNNVATRQIAEEFGIPYQTVYTWVVRKKAGGNPMAVKGKGGQRWTPQMKLQAVVATFSMTEEELGAYCREQGLYSAQIREWRAMGIDSSNNLVDIKAYQQAKQENKELKRELYRKDKALAETSALLVLKKKADLIWGEGKDD